MSDTPRTDNSVLDTDWLGTRVELVNADFARKLERENQQLKQTVLATLSQRGQKELIVAWDRVKELERENAALRAVICTQSSLLKRWLELADQQSETLDPMTYTTFQKKDGLVGDTHSVLNTLNESKNT